MVNFFKKNDFLKLYLKIYQKLNIMKHSHQIKTFLISIFFLIIYNTSFSQLLINGAAFIIDSGAIVTVQGDLISNTNIQGSGKIIMSGGATQNINMGGFGLPTLEINNGQNVNLLSDVRIEKGLNFTLGKIQSSSFNLTLSTAAITIGAADSKFVEMTGSGQVYKELSADVNNYEMPIGAGSIYRPAYISSSATTYDNAKIGIKAIAIANPNKPIHCADYLSTYWPVTRSGITGTVSVSGQYADATDIVGAESNLRGYFYDGTDWSSANGSNDAVANKIGAPVLGTGGTIYGMSKMLLVGARAFLQGAYNSTTGLMTDAIRTVLPASDPYRNAPYNTAFNHVNNSTPETIEGTPFITQSIVANNIVDWVFLELRNTNASPGNTILQTRSALIQRDGDIVDVDGVSPVTFSNLPDGNYGITVRHRNHLSMSLSPTLGSVALSEKKSTAFTTNVADLRTALPSSIYGTTAGFTTASHPTLTTVNLLWGGNANSNGNSKYSGATNDRAVILSDLSNNELGTLSGYNRSDINLNGIVKYSGAGNDRSFLLSSVLLNNELGFRTEQKPN